MPRRHRPGLEYGVVGINRIGNSYSEKARELVAISSDGKTLATGCSNQIILWDFVTGKKLRVLSGSTPWALDFSPDGKTLVSGSSRSTTSSCGMSQPVCNCVPFTNTRTPSWEPRFHPMGHTLATAGNEGVLRLWEAASFEEIESYPSTLEAMFRLGKLRVE